MSENELPDDPNEDVEVSAGYVLEEPEPFTPPHRPSEVFKRITDEDRARRDASARKQQALQQAYGVPADPGKSRVAPRDERLRRQAEAWIARREAARAQREADERERIAMEKSLRDPFTDFAEDMAKAAEQMGQKPELRHRCKVWPLGDGKWAWKCLEPRVYCHRHGAFPDYAQAVNRAVRHTTFSGREAG